LAREVFTACSHSVTPWNRPHSNSVHPPPPDEEPEEKDGEAEGNEVVDDDADDDDDDDDDAVIAAFKNRTSLERIALASTMRSSEKWTSLTDGFKWSNVCVVLFEILRV